MGLLRLADATVHGDPFPHLTLYPALDEDAYRAVKAAVPAPEHFGQSGKGRKIDLDLAEKSPSFGALPSSAKADLERLRDAVRVAAPALAETFKDALVEKYRWLLGDSLAQEIAEAGWTTTNGRIMGRAPGYDLKPHLDSAHFGVTCLLYLSDAPTPEAGALALYKTERQPQVNATGTYYPEKAEGVHCELAKVVPVRENLFVAFVSGPNAVHGLTRDPATATGWRYAYQCHVIPAAHDIKAIGPRLEPEFRSRWLRPSLDEGY
jgi:hypothetical protein